MAGEPVQRRLQFVLEKYGKRPTENIILNYFGMANEVYTITTAEGRFVVKNCFKQDTREKVANEAALIQFLNEHQVPCPKLVPTLAGDAFLEYDHSFYLMSEFVEGFTPTWEEPLTEGLLAESMKAMAEFHRASEFFTPPNNVARIHSLDMDKHRHWLKTLAVELTSMSDKDSLYKEMLDLIPRYNALIAKLQIEINKADLSQLKKVYIHGDLHCFNLIFSADRSRYIGVVDFDFSCEDYRLVDFLWSSRTFLWGYALPKLFGEAYRHGQTEPSAQQMQAAVTESFAFMVKTYRQYHDLPETELRLLPLFVYALPLYTLRFFKTSNSIEECRAHLEWFKEQLDQLDANVAFLANAIETFFAK